jgi:hypothetical protein
MKVAGMASFATPKNPSTVATEDETATIKHLRDKFEVHIVPASFLGEKNWSVHQGDSAQIMAALEEADLPEKLVDVLAKQLGESAGPEMTPLLRERAATNPRLRFALYRSQSSDYGEAKERVALFKHFGIETDYDAMGLVLAPIPAISSLEVAFANAGAEKKQLEKALHNLPVFELRRLSDGLPNEPAVSRAYLAANPVAVVAESVVSNSALAGMLAAERGVTVSTLSNLDIATWAEQKHASEVAALMKQGAGAARSDLSEQVPRLVAEQHYWRRSFNAEVNYVPAPLSSTIPHAHALNAVRAFIFDTRRVLVRAQEFEIEVELRVRKTGEAREVAFENVLREVEKQGGFPEPFDLPDQTYSSSEWREMLRQGRPFNDTNHTDLRHRALTHRLLWALVIREMQANPAAFAVADRAPPTAVELFKEIGNEETNRQYDVWNAWFDSNQNNFSRPEWIVEQKKFFPALGDWK